METGNKIAVPRNKKGLYRDAFGKIIGASDIVIGRYEIDGMTPSVEIAKKIADALDVSLVYLTGSTAFAIRDKKMLYRLEIMVKIDKNQRATILEVVDSLLQSYQRSSTRQKLVYL